MGMLALSSQRALTRHTRAAPRRFAGGSERAAGLVGPAPRADRDERQPVRARDGLAGALRVEAQDGARVHGDLLPVDAVRPTPADHDDDLLLAGARLVVLP